MIRPLIVVTLQLFLSACINVSGVGNPDSIDALSCWDELAEDMGPQDTKELLASPSIAARGDHLWVAWSDVNRTTALQARRWNGRAWSKIPGPAGGGNPVVRLSLSGEAYLVWDAGSGIHVGRWNGTAWSPMGAPLRAPSDSYTNVGAAALVLDSDGFPVVAWQESVGNDPRSLHVARWNGTAWTMLGNAVATGVILYSLAPTLAIDDKGDVWIAWKSGSEDRQNIRVARWSGGSWRDIGNTASGVLSRGNEVFGPQIVLLPGDLALVAWVERSKTFTSSLALMRWTGSSWEQVPSPPAIANSQRGPWIPSLGQTSDGKILLAWAEADATEIASVHVSRLTKDGWESIWSGMRRTAGPSNAENVKLAVGSAGDFYLAWDEPDDRDQRTRVIRTRSCSSGERPAALPVVRARSSYWPKTVDAAAEEILSKMPSDSRARVRATPRKDLIQFHMDWGRGIRNELGLWAGNTALLESCGGDKAAHPDHCSMVIIERVWERLQRLPE